MLHLLILFPSFAILFFFFFQAEDGIRDVAVTGVQTCALPISMSNVFLVRDERLLTPRLDRCGVAGGMRRGVLAEAAKAGVAPRGRTLGSRGLAAAPGGFLTNPPMGGRPGRGRRGRGPGGGAPT